MDIDPRDWKRLRERMIYAEEHIRELQSENKRIRAEMALFQQGVKERLDVFGLLLTGVENTVDREKLG